MHITILTNEYPPDVYGGAGVHVEYLTRELVRLDDGLHRVEVLTFGKQKEEHGNLTVHGVSPRLKPPYQDERHRRFMETILKDTMMAGSVKEADVVHCHTWYSHLAGCLLKHLLGAPLVLTTHSLEPHRPWKVEQLGTAYQASSWIEKTAYQNADGVIAVSKSMRQDVHDAYGVPFNKIRVIHNGIDLEQYKYTEDESVLKSYNIDPEKPFVLFVGRITRQKGIIHLVNAIKYLRPDLQIVLCAGAPDTKEIGKEMEEKVAEARKGREKEVIWISEMLPKDQVIKLYSHAALFVCPSVYEPFGIINLEAMACGTPVVASAVGGIPEIIVHEETGLLVPIEITSPTDIEPRDPEKFSRHLAAAINSLLSEPEKLRSMGEKSRKRVEEHFSWAAIARETLNFYDELVRKQQSQSAV